MSKPIAHVLTGLLATSLLMGCREVRYTENAPEIDTFKRLNEAFISGDFSVYPEIYADSARIYYNSTSPLSWQQAAEGMQTSLEAFTEYGYSEEDEFEFVTTDKGEQWLSWWSVFKGTLKENGVQVEIPLHISARFVDGKIVEESGYWDNQIISDALGASRALEGLGD